MPGIRARMMHQGHAPDYATVGECSPEKYYCLPGFLQLPYVWVSDNRHTYAQNQRRCPSVKNPDFGVKTGVLFCFTGYSPILPEIVLANDAI